MSANLNKTKRRILSINSTKKITNAMELVATVKLKRYKDVMMQNSNYVSEIVNLIHKLSYYKNSDKLSLFELPNDATKDLYIVINSNLGLCASYNNDIYKFVESNIDKNTAQILPIGLKGDQFYKKQGYDLDESFYDLNEKLDYVKVIKLSRYIESLFLNGKFRNIYLIYTRYVNSIKFVPDMIKIYPLEAEQEVNREDRLEYAPIFDPDVDTLFDELIPIYTSALLYQKIVESQVSEQASRRTAMENATDNADELIDKLTLEYNKARQAAITQEITEVVSSSLDK